MEQIDDKREIPPDNASQFNNVPLNKRISQ